MKKISPEHVVIPDPWTRLREFTDARIGLGRAGTSIPVSECLQFKLAHAQARDAVHLPFNRTTIATRLTEAGIPCQLLESSATDRHEYLTRPDLGRRLNKNSRNLLSSAPNGFDISLVICDGLSTRAIHENSVELATSFWSHATNAGFSMAPVQIVENGRVAIGDEIAALLQAQLVIILIGERPGLSSPNSLGIYMTYCPIPGTTDEIRNCISNVRDKGLPITAAVQKLSYLVESAFTAKLSGVRLKDKMDKNYIPFSSKRALTTDGDAY